jgi:hypothetical protein
MSFWLLHYGGQELLPSYASHTDNVRYHELVVVNAHGAQTYRRWHRDVLPNSLPFPELAGAAIERVDADQPTRTIRACQHRGVL